MAYLIFGGLSAAFIAALWWNNYGTTEAKPRYDFYIWQEGDSLNAAQEWEQRRRHDELNPNNSSWWMIVPAIMIIYVLAFIAMA